MNYSSASSSKIIVQNVLSLENKQRTLQTLKSFSFIGNSSKTISKRRAAVLVPLCITNGELSLLLTVRAMSLRNNRGQVAFPGGMEDSDDKTLEETVLRETKEEVGIESSFVDVWGKGPSVGREDMMVTPFLAYVGEIVPDRLRINQQEVQEVFTTPLATLCEAKNFRTTHFRSRKGHYVLPVFITPTFRVWGLTALITHTILMALLPGQYHNKVQDQVLKLSNLPRVVFAANLIACHNWIQIPLI